MKRSRQIAWSIAALAATAGLVGMISLSQARSHLRQIVSSTWSRVSADGEFVATPYDRNELNRTPGEGDRRRLVVRSTGQSGMLRGPEAIAVFSQPIRSVTWRSSAEVVVECAPGAFIEFQQTTFHVASPQITLVSRPPEGK